MWYIQSSIGHHSDSGILRKNKKENKTPLPERSIIINNLLILAQKASPTEQPAKCLRGIKLDGCSVSLHGGIEQLYWFVHDPIKSTAWNRKYMEITGVSCPL